MNMAAFNISIGDQYFFHDYGPHAKIPIIFNRPPEIVITAEVAEVVSEVVQLVFDPVRVGVKSVWHLKANPPHLD